MDAPLDDSYSSRKRTHSSAQGLQTSPFLEGQGHDGNDNGPSPAFGSHWSKGAPNSNPTETSSSYRALRLQRSQPGDINDRAPSSQQPFDIAMASASDATEQGALRDLNPEGDAESINL